MSGSYQDFLDGEKSAAVFGLIAGGVLLLAAVVLLTITVLR